MIARSANDAGSIPARITKTKKLVRSYMDHHEPVTRLAVFHSDKWWATHVFIRYQESHKGKKSLLPYRVYLAKKIVRAFKTRQEAEEYVLKEADVTGK